MVQSSNECSYVHQARNVQHAGGALTVVLDTNDKADRGTSIMGDDGTGAGLNTPAILIKREPSKLFMEYLQEASEHDINNIELRVAFFMQAPRPFVNVKMWYTSSDDRSMDFIADMGEFLRPVLGELQFYPKVVHYECKWCDVEAKKLNCLSNGSYCAVVPKPTDTFHGRDIVMEDLRQACLFEKLELKAQSEKWSTYI